MYNKQANEKAVSWIVSFGQTVHSTMASSSLPRQWFADRCRVVESSGGSWWTVREVEGDDMMLTRMIQFYLWGLEYFCVGILKLYRLKM